MPLFHRDSALRPTASSVALSKVTHILWRATLGITLGVILVSCSIPDGPSPDAPSPNASSPNAPTSPTDDPSAASPTDTMDSPITLNGPGQLLPITAIAEIKGERFDLEVAQTPDQQALGLMFRSALPDNRGMPLSVFVPQAHPILDERRAGSVGYGVFYGTKKLSRSPLKRPLAPQNPAPPMARMINS